MHDVPQRLILGPIVSYRYLILINDLPKIWIGNSLQILLDDDSSVAITNSNIAEFQSNIKAVFEQMISTYQSSLIKLILSILKQKTLITEILWQNMTIDKFLIYPIQISYE